MIIPIKDFPEGTLVLSQLEDEAIFIHGNDNYLEFQQGEDIIVIRKENVKDLIKAIKKW